MCRDFFCRLKEALYDQLQAGHANRAKLLLYEEMVQQPKFTRLTGHMPLLGVSPGNMPPENP